MSAGLVWRDAAAHAHFRSLGLPALDALKGDLDEPRLGEIGRCVTKARTRRLYFLTAPDGPAYYVKIQVAPPSALPLRRWVRYAARPSPVVLEARACEVLSGLGLNTAPVLASGARGRFPATVRAALVTRELRDHVDVRQYIEEEEDESRCVAAVEAVEALVARVHAAGLAFGHVRHRNFLVPRARPVALDEIVIIDAGGLSRSRRKQERDKQHLALERGRRL